MTATVKKVDAPFLNTLDFWDHQKKAIEIAQNYISRFNNGQVKHL